MATVKRMPIKLENVGIAVSDLDAAIGLEPGNSMHLVQRGMVRHARGEVERAIADYDEAIKRDPSLALAYNNRGVAWRDKGDLKRALSVPIISGFFPPPVKLVWR